MDYFPMSSRYTTTTPSEMRSLKIASIMVWKVARLLVRPKKGCLPFISFFHSDIVETPTDIKFGKVLSPLQFINELGDEG